MPKYWSALPFLPPENLPEPGIKPTSPVAPALASKFLNTEPPGKLIPDLLQNRKEGKGEAELKTKQRPAKPPSGLSIPSMCTEKTISRTKGHFGG